MRYADASEGSSLLPSTQRRGTFRIRNNDACYNAWTWVLVVLSVCSMCVFAVMYMLGIIQVMEERPFVDASSGQPALCIVAGVTLPAGSGAHAGTVLVSFYLSHCLPSSSAYHRQHVPYGLFGPEATPPGTVLTCFTHAPADCTAPAAIHPVFSISAYAVKMFAVPLLLLAGQSVLWLFFCLGRWPKVWWC